MTSYEDILKHLELDPHEYEALKTLFDTNEISEENLDLLDDDKLNEFRAELHSKTSQKTEQEDFKATQKLSSLPSPESKMLEQTGCGICGDPSHGEADCPHAPPTP